MNWIKENSAVFMVILGLIGYAEIRHRALLSAIDQFKSEIRSEIEKNYAEIQRNRETITEVRSLLMRHIEMHNTLAHACMPPNAKNRTANRQNHSRIRKASPLIAKQSHTKGVKTEQDRKPLPPLTAKK